MHIKQLECFVHLSETLSFSRTAELLYITQPTVTHQINTLEDELKYIQTYLELFEDLAKALAE